MKKQAYRSMESRLSLNRRDFFRVGGAAGAAAGIGLFAGRSLAAAQAAAPAPPAKPATNIADALKAPRTASSLPGPFPGRVVEVCDPASVSGAAVDAAAVRTMFEKGIAALTGKNLASSFGLFFNKDDVVGIKINPVGAGLISTRLEVVDAIIGWLAANGLPRRNIVVWDRFDYMVKDAGFTPQRFPGVSFEGLQTMDEAAAEGKAKDNSRWLRPDGSHVSADNFDKDVYYWADVEGSKDEAYLNQHVFNGKYSYFGKLLTRRLTKIINVPVFKNTGNAISMATKNIGYGAVCNTNRLHQPLFLDVCVEVPAFPVVRDKWVLTVTDGIKGQYDGGPGPEAKFIYDQGALFFGTDPIAMDLVCHNLLVAKRKEMGVKVNEHPRMTEYLRYGEKMGLGIADPAKITHLKA
jgi:hypothetical protein